jgi:hypothetical protein
VQFKVERRYQASGLLASTLERNSVYSKGPAATGPDSANVPGLVVPLLIVSTTRMPLPVVSAPAPVVLAIRRSALPPALPPLITSRSDGEGSLPRKVLSPSKPPLPTKFCVVNVL